MTASPATAAPSATDPSTHAQRVTRLVDLAKGAGHDAFDDVPWDEHDLDPTDPRMRLWHFDPLAWTPWYQRLDPAEQARVGTLRFAHNMRVGWEFENLLQQGLLIQAWRMGNDDRRFAFVHHEVVEESHHSMMFHEFTRRYAPEVKGMSPALRGIGEVIAQVGSRRLPALFYFLVLSGELPVDHLQRRALREQADLHPLVRRILQIHVEEEARHVSFANLELRRIVPTLPAASRHALAVAVPSLLGVMARLMLFPSPALLSHLEVPRQDVVAMRTNPMAQQLQRDLCERVRALARELDLLTPAGVAAWRAAGIWDSRTVRRGRAAAA